MSQTTRERNKALVLEAFLVEHWDVIQDEASPDQSKSGLPMFGDRFPK
jgi:predicted SnoaL-like aldol condensation-catalyzing enzyme